MATSSEMAAFDRGVRPLMQIVLPEKAEEIVAFHADAELRERIDELAEKSTEGQLTEAETAEYSGYVRANKFIAVLQQHARRIIESQPKTNRTSD